ncbi:MAG: ADP-heptose--LPS heptosyltransferase [Hydrogenobaculum sp.]|nr:MAG: ADP-heptose--LPS heptosyltransferase [Hydrogenobaculum sp.]
MSVIVKVSKELYVEDLKKSFLPNKLYVLPKDVYESYIKSGIPIDYVDSLKTVFDKTNDFNNKKILILTMQALGDGLMLTPFLRFLKENFQNIHIALETKEHFNLLKDCPYVDEFVYSPTELSFVKSFDIVLDLYMLVGSPMFDLNLVSSYYFKLFGFKTPEHKEKLIPYVYVDEEIDKEIKKLFDDYRNIYKKPILGFHFSASSPHRMPPVDIFCDAIAPLQNDFTIVYSYPSQYKDYAKQIQNYLPKAVDISSHIKSVQHLPSYVKNLDFLISVETVLPHIAAAVKTPTLVVLGPGSFKNIYDYGIDFIKALEMNYKGQICSSPCHLHVSTRCPEAVVKQTNLSPCFSNLNSFSLTNKFLELLKAINKKDLLKQTDSGRLVNRGRLVEQITIEENINKIIFRLISTLPVSFFYEAGLSFISSIPYLKNIMSFVINSLFVKSLNWKNFTPILIARGFESVVASLFVKELWKDNDYRIYVENEHYKKILYYLDIDSHILDYETLYIPNQALVIDLSLSSEEPYDYKKHVDKVSKRLKEDSIFFSFVFNKDRLKNTIQKGQDTYQPPFDNYINDVSYQELSDFQNYHINYISINPADFINIFGDYSIFKEISPHNQAFRLLIKNNSLYKSYCQIFALSNIEHEDNYEDITRFYSFIEKTYMKAEHSAYTNISDDNVKTLCFLTKSLSKYLENHIKTYFENALTIKMPIFDKNIVEKYIEKYTDIENIWFLGDAFIDYFKQDLNFLKHMLFGPSLNILIDKNPFLDDDYLITLVSFLRDFPNVNFYTTHKGVYDIFGKKHQNLKYLEINPNDIEPLVPENKKTIDILIVSSSSFIKNIKYSNELDTEEFYSSYINGFSKNLQRIILDFIKEKTGKKDLYYEDKVFLDFYKDITNNSASLNYFIAQEIKNIASKYTKNILHIGNLNFLEPKSLKELALEHLKSSRYLPDILITQEDFLDFIAKNSKFIVYLDGLENFQKLPYFCLKASKSGIACITKYQKFLEDIKAPNIILPKNIEELLRIVDNFMRGRLVNRGILV